MTILHEARRDEGPDTHKVSRWDRGTLRPSFTTEQGFLLAEGIGAFAGVHEYLIRGRDGKARIVRELVDDEVLKQDAGQIGRLPLTLHHPDEDVSPANVQDLGVGDVGERVQYIEDEQGGYVQLSICARRADAIAAVQAGTAAELSFGYDVFVKEVGGVHPVYGRYDQQQVKRTYNHLALVDMARHGPDARVRADSAEDLPEGWIGIQINASRLEIIKAADAKSTKFPAPGHGESMDFLKLLAAGLKIPRMDALTEDGLKEAIRDRGFQLVRVEASVEPLRDGRSDMAAHELVADMANAHSAFKTDMEAEQEKLVADMAALQGSYDAMQSELNGLKNQHQAETDRADTADAGLASLQSKIDTAAGELVILKASAVDTAAKLVTAEGIIASAALTAKKAADAGELAGMSKLAGELNVELAALGEKKDLTTLRKDCATVIYGAEIDESFNQDSITGILAPALRRIKDGLSAVPDAADPRYKSTTIPVVDPTTTPARPSLRTRADHQHTGGSVA